MLHHCPYCGFATEVASALPAFAENPHCRQCGLSASESDVKMANDLAMLFARQMNMGIVPPAEAPLSASPPTPNSTPPTPFSASAAPPQPYSITQHYHHSSHLAFPAAESTLSDLQNAHNMSPEDLLRSQGIDPASLWPSQLTLFTHAKFEQKARLIELWRISNPSTTETAQTRTGHPHNQTTRPETSTTQDTEMNMDMEMDADDDHPTAEPYVLSGYESLAQREYEASANQQPQQQQEYKPSNDPVYKGHDFWHAPQQQSLAMPPSMSSSTAAMENQYGAHEVRTMYFGCGVRRPHWLDGEEML